MILCPACGEGAFRLTPASSVTECLCGGFSVYRDGPGFEWRFLRPEGLLIFRQDMPAAGVYGKGGLYFSGDWMGRLSPSERESFVRETMDLCLAESVLES